MTGPYHIKSATSVYSSNSTVCVSLSGGKTSAYMAYILKKYSNNKLIFVFANTGQENEETLEFVEMCDRHFGLGVVWVEAVVNKVGISTGHVVVDFCTASRKGEPFERVISKYGISNKSYPHCTRELKANQIKSYMRTVSDEYFTAIGIRADEYRRVKPIRGLLPVYPLADCWITTKEEVNMFWEKQPFNLDLYDYQGNCKWCWKKGVFPWEQINKRSV